MKTSVRFLSMLLVIVMIASAALTAFATNVEKASYDEALQLLVDLGIIAGYEDGSLKPDNLVERDEMAKIIYVLYTTFVDAGEGTVSFKDVPADNWANGYISWCSAKGIVGGYGNGNFGPDDNVTYDQALKMVCGALGYTDWDSLLWPTDVRTKALIDLKLGEGIEGVAGSDKVTRGQVAQIVYNALFADMKSTTTTPSTIGGVLTIDTPKTLAADVWGFGEMNTSISAAGTINCVKFAEEESEVYVDDLGEFTLEQLGLESYKDNIDELFLANVRIFYNKANVVSGNPELEDIIAVSVKPTLEKDVEITLNKTKEQVLLNGKELSEDVELVAANGKGVVFTALDLLDAADFVSYDELAEDDTILGYYNIYAYDINGDSKFDYVTACLKSALQVSNVSKDKIIYNVFGLSENKTIDIKNVISSVELEEDDVAVAYSYYNNLVIEQIVEPVTASAVKYSSTKLTLDGVGEVAINEQIWADVPVCEVGSSVMLVDEEGNTSKYDYYIYDGKVFGSTATASDETHLYAILHYINKPSDAVFDAESKTFNNVYSALVTIDGKTQTVKLNPENTIAGLSMIEDSADILETYGKAFTNNGVDEAEGGKYALNRYLLVEYTVDKNGLYSFTLPEVTADPENNEEEYTIYNENLTLKYNKAIGLYALVDSNDSAVAPLVIIDDDTVLYYSYTKDTTGLYRHLGAYNAATLPENLASISVTSKLVTAVDEATGFTKVVVAVINKDSIAVEEEVGADFRVDARELFYCYQDSNEVLASDFKSLNYTYFMRPIYEGINLPESEPKSALDGATPTAKGYFYAWDKDSKSYKKVTNSTLTELEITSIGIYTLSEVFNDCFFTVEGKYAGGIGLAEDAMLCTFKNSTWNASAITMADVESYLEVAEEHEKTLSIIIGTHIDESGNEVASVVFLQCGMVSGSGEFLTNTSPFGRFKE